MRLTLKDVGLPYKKVMKGRNWIGRVYRVADGSWSCDIHRKNYYRGAASAFDAFMEGGARYLGADSADDLRAKNRQANIAKRYKRRAAADLMNRVLHNEPGAFDRLIDIFDGKVKL